jgi:hypothetical protein
MMVIDVTGVRSGHAWGGLAMKLHGIGNVAIYVAPIADPIIKVVYFGINASGNWTWSIFVVQ